jgi:hypothetical protein
LHDIARDRKSKTLPLMALIALICAESGKAFTATGAEGATDGIAVIARHRNVIAVIGSPKFLQHGGSPHQARTGLAGDPDGGTEEAEEIG